MHLFAKYIMIYEHSSYCKPSFFLPGLADDFQNIKASNVSDWSVSGGDAFSTHKTLCAFKASGGSGKQHHIPSFCGTAGHYWIRMVRRFLAFITL